MIDYETFCKIKRYREEEHLTLAQTARALGLHPRTVAQWARTEQYRARRSASRASQLDPFKPDIVRWLEAHPLSAAQIFQRLREAGYPGGYPIVKDYVHRVRPRRAPAFLTLAFAPGKPRKSTGASMAARRSWRPHKRALPPRASTRL